MIQVERHEVTAGLFHCWYTLTNFENNKTVAPVNFEFFIRYYAYCTLLYIDLFLASDPFLVHYDLSGYKGEFCFE